SKLQRTLLLTRFLLTFVWLTTAVCEAASPREITTADIERWMTELSNWGRWGKEDQLGAINLITAAKSRQAAALVKEGITVSLAHDEDTVKSIDNPSPLVQTMVWTGANTPGPFLMDTYAWTSDPRSSYHGFFHTHLDALCHMFYKGKMYNGFSKDEVTKDGAAKLAVS